MNAHPIVEAGLAELPALAAIPALTAWNYLFGSPDL